MAQIISANPIVHDTIDVKKYYLKLLKKYIHLVGGERRLYESSQLKAYEAILLKEYDEKKEYGLDYYKYFILFDLLHVMGYKSNVFTEDKMVRLREQYLKDFPNSDKSLYKKIIISTQGSTTRLVNLGKNELLTNEKEYIEKIRENLIFSEKEPFKLMVTATMSAGKSSVINALIGKYICLSQNMACTSKIHSIINKPFEDGLSTEYDHDLVMTAGKEELLNDNDANESDMIHVATNFKGCLSSSRIIINDSPGVNFSGNEEHRLLANKLIKRKKYDLLIYVMNVTQLGTNDENEHLEYIKSLIGRIPILFVMNKIDAINVDEENVSEIIERQVKYLKSKGFKNPMVCPISARAGYLAKQFENGNLSRSEKRELYNYVDKFEQMNLQHYYKEKYKRFRIIDSDSEEIQLIKTSGLAYLEKVILTYINGGKKK